MQLQTSLLLCLVLGTNTLPRGGRGGRGGGRGGGGGRWSFGRMGRSSRGGSYSSYGSSSSRLSSSSGSGNSRTTAAPSTHRQIPYVEGVDFFKLKPTVFKPNLFGQSQYSSFSKPMRPTGKYAGAAGAMYGYRIGDQGTNWGTSFPGGTGKFRGRISEKTLGLGVSSSFLGGSAAGTTGTMATYSVYHRCTRIATHIALVIIRYHEFQRMMYINNPSSLGVLSEGNLEQRGVQNPRPLQFSLDDDFYTKYYSRLQSNPQYLNPKEG